MNEYVKNVKVTEHLKLAEHLKVVSVDPHNRVSGLCSRHSLSIITLCTFLYLRNSMTRL